MFRRKEENSNDPSNPAAATSANPAAGNAYAEGANSAAHAPQTTHAHSSSAPAAQGSASNAYVPTVASARPAAPSAQEPVRAGNTAPAAASSYRPTPIAEFNRGAARNSGDTMRTGTSSQTASFNASADKSGTQGKSNRRVLTVGNDILLKGEIATCDRLVIEGRVEAKLSDVHTVEIAECGSFKGTAEVEDAEISGVFEGDLIVRNRLIIYTSGEVRGNISYGEIEIERGGRLTGQIKTVAAAAAKGKSAFVESDKARAPSKETAAA